MYFRSARLLQEKKKKILSSNNGILCILLKEHRLVVYTSNLSTGEIKTGDLYKF